MTTDLSASFRSWLSSKNYSDSTVRNYLVDVGKYLDFVQARYSDKPFNEIHIFSPDLLGPYLQHLSTQNNSARYLASLNLFCQFAVDQNLTTQNPLATLKHQLAKPIATTSSNTLISQFSDYLTHQNHTPATIKNYINDIQSYFSWLETAIQNQK